MHLIFLLLTIEFTFDIIDTRRSQKREQGPKDLNAFLKDNRVIVSALRTAKDLDATDEEWQDFIDKLRKSREGKP